MPVPRWRVFAGTVLLLAGLFALGAMTQLLRHPLPGGETLGPPELEAAAGDPRDEAVCPEPLPREGQPRQDVPVQDLQRVTSTELYNCPQTYDGTVVRFRGEAIGAVLWRGDHAWVHLNDDVYSEVLGPLPTHRGYRGGNAGVGALVPRELAAQIRHVGGPKHRGDVLEVIGVFQRVDPATREVAILRVQHGQVTTPGGVYSDPILVDRLVVAAIVGPLALGLVVVKRIQGRRR